MKKDKKKEIKFTHDEVFMVGGEYYKSKKTGEWVSETKIVGFSDESIKSQIEIYNAYSQDKYY